MVGERDAADVRVFPPLIPLAALVASVVLDRLVPLGTGLELPETACRWIGGAIVAGALVGLGGWSVLILRMDGQSENPWKPTFRLIEKGPFRITRNPMYLQMVLVCIGLAIALLNWWLLLLTPVAGWLLQHLAILPEERYLEAKFGEQYLAYKRRTRRWL